MPRLTSLERRILKESRKRPGGRRPSLRKIAEALEGEACHETVRRTLIRLGREVQTPEEAAESRRLYPRPWECAVCGLEREAETWNEYRRETCSKECKDELRRQRFQEKREAAG